MGKLFGTDGIRGVVGENLTAEQAFRVGQAVASVLAEEQGRRPVIMIGKDTRISSDMLESALMAGICSVGGDVKPLGTIPTPAVAYLTVREGADAGIVISASHNPYEHNGIKVFNGQGYKLPDATERRVEEKILSPEPVPAKTRGEIGRRFHGMRQLKQDYINFVASTAESDLAGLRILVDCANGAASATAPELFGRFKAHTDFINREPDGVNINNRCGSTHLEDLSRSVVAGKYDVGVAFDGDADRCLLVDEQGGVIDGDRVLAVCASSMKRRGKLNGNTIVATVMSNLGLHEFCRSSGIDLVCTNVGDRNVLEKMLGNDFRIGGEQSGHTIFTELETTGDGEVTALQFLRVLKDSGIRASELAACCPVYPQVLVNVEVPHSGGVKEKIMASRELSEAANQEEVALNGSGRVLVRASGTEALIRVMVEAKSSELAQQSANRLVNFINSLKNTINS
ncbi:MAG: phosphoglucosamine mutase [Oscillibacter sp.]|nr:phosphoglucosamine mutase [Oscillibacter sp.]